MKMNKRAVLFVSLFAFTSIVAVAMPFYTVNAALVPCGLSQDDPNTPGIDETHACTTCDFFVLADRAKNFLLIDILTPVAVLFIVIGGIMILTAGARPANIQYGKKIISDTIIGVFIIFSAWMITNTIIQLFAGSSNLSTWYSISCKEGDIKIGGTTPPGQVPPGGACALPLDPSKVRGYNGHVHNPWPGPPFRHRPIRSEPNGPPPLGAVDLAIGQNAIPIFAPISGKVHARGTLANTGDFIIITAGANPGSNCANANSSCATLAHIVPSVNVGATVVAGQQVGILKLYNGDLGPHLHFELKLNGQWILGDGKGGTWSNQKTALATCSGNTSGGDSNPPSGTVNASTTVTNLVIDMQYASANPSSYNFMRTALYVGSNSKYGQACYLTQTVANKLKAANDKLQQVKPGWKIKAWDCYRPLAIQQQMYDWSVANGKVGLVAKPTATAQHPRGMAIDLTLVDASGRDVAMPTHFDYFERDQKQDPRTSAYRNSPNRSNSELLNSIMTATGLIRAKNEWWHFGLP